jgi:hypothetical protein
MLAVLTAGFIAAFIGASQTGYGLQQCVPTSNAQGWLGTKLALVHTSEACPSGELALGSGPAHLVTVLVCATLPVIVAYVLNTWLGLLLTLTIRRVLRTGKGWAVARILRLAAHRPVAYRSPRRDRAPRELVRKPAEVFLTLGGVRGPPVAIAVAG